MIRDLLFFFLLISTIGFSYEEIVFSGSQAGCSGKVDTSAVMAICKELETKQEAGIYFNKNCISSYLTGGTCSAMALTFLSQYINGYWEEELFVESSLAMRNLQAAYNTIEVIKQEGLDYGQQKAQSLLNYFGLVIESSSCEIDLREEGAFSRLSSLDEHLEGIYFIRILKPSENKRLEVRGHSLIYSKIQGGALLYDPNSGLSLVDIEGLFSVFTCYITKYGVYNVRFYKIKG